MIDIWAEHRADAVLARLAARVVERLASDAPPEARRACFAIAEGYPPQPSEAAHLAQALAAALAPEACPECGGTGACQRCE